MQARLQRSTQLKKILQDTREAGGESDVRDRMQPLSNQLVETISHLHEVFASRVFVAVCRGYWDRMARVGHLFHVPSSSSLVSPVFDNDCCVDVEPIFRNMLLVLDPS